MKKTKQNNKPSEQMLEYSEIMATRGKSTTVNFKDFQTAFYILILIPTDELRRSSPSPKELLFTAEGHMAGND